MELVKGAREEAEQLLKHIQKCNCVRKVKSTTEKKGKFKLVNTTKHNMQQYAKELQTCMTK